MLPSADALASGIEFFARRHGRSVQIDRAAVAGAIAHAAELAGGEDRTEPAALFFACALRSRTFGVTAQLAVPFLARSQAHRVGLHLDAKDIELDILRARVLLHAISFTELAAFFAARLRAPPSVG